MFKFIKNTIVEKKQRKFMHSKKEPESLYLLPCINHLSADQIHTQSKCKNWGRTKYGGYSGVWRYLRLRKYFANELRHRHIVSVELFVKLAFKLILYMCKLFFLEIKTLCTSFAWERNKAYIVLIRTSVSYL